MSSVQTQNLSFVATVDGILITMEDGEEKFIKHSVFRSWAFNKGYYSGAYYKFVENLNERTIQSYLNHVG